MPRSVNPRPQFFDSSGDPLAYGLMYFYEPGTTTDKTTYSDVNLSTANSNPVVLSADGRLPSVFFDGTARQVLRDADSVLIWDVDPVGGANITGPLSQWSPDVTYGLYDIVITSDGRLWRSLQAANTDNAPASSATWWEQLEFITIWNANVTYALNATVKGSNGLFFKSLANGNLGNDPTTDAVNWGPPVDVLAFGLADGGLKTASFSAGGNTRYRCPVGGTITLPTPTGSGDTIVVAIYGSGTTFLSGIVNGITSATAFAAVGDQTLIITDSDATRGWV